MGFCEVRYTRRYNATPAEVWAALTEPESVARWLGNVPTRVRETEPERLLELDWLVPGDEPSVVRFELTSRENGTELVLDHRRINAVLGGAYSERWANTLLRLDELLAGVA
ncbi:MAG: SRPBCC domain-containing protein [Actinobacteria bacterium]|nr:SRPBCC domain-containing protein [Actinomycetota bacterium]